MTRIKAIATAVGVALALACERAPSPAAPTASSGDPSRTVGDSNGVQASASGGGHYLLQNAFDTQFAFTAVLHANGRASGNFHQHLETDTGAIDFTGRVTCLAIDDALHRAWVGGVIERNDSTDPSFTLPQHQIGHDIWFRVLDAGEGDGAVDRTTFVGFEGAISSSEAYCRDRIWPADNARTWLVTSGNLTVHR